MMQPPPIQVTGRPQGPRSLGGALAFVGLLVAAMVAIDYPLVGLLTATAILVGPQVLSQLRPIRRPGLGPRFPRSIHAKPRSKQHQGNRRSPSDPEPRS